MFNHILKLKQQAPKQDELMAQQNVLPPINKANAHSLTESSSLRESTLKRTENRQTSKRLKLKDYMRLNEISRQKRSRSVGYNKINANQKLNSSQPVEIRATFGKQIETNEPTKKNAKKYTEYAQLQRSQLMKTIEKIKDKLLQMVSLIEETTQKFTTYNDLVFMFGIEQILNEYIKKGIHKVTDAYKEYFNANSNNEIGSEEIGVKIQRIMSAKNTQTLQKTGLQPDKQKDQRIKVLQDEKNVNFGILPVSVAIKSPNKSCQLYETFYPSKKAY